VPSLRGAIKAENIPIEPDLDNASEGKMTRLTYKTVKKSPLFLFNFLENENKIFTIHFVYLMDG
jgi:hypothetical protein